MVLIFSTMLLLAYVFTDQVPYRQVRVGDEEIRQVVFAKVHKAASSTVQNILLRFAMARDLDVLLPLRQNHISELTPKIDPKIIIPHQRGKPFDILCNHIIFDANQIAAYIPTSAFRFGILREPMAQALSALQFYSTLYPVDRHVRGVKRFPEDPVQGFLNHPRYFCEEQTSPEFCFTDNRMSVDLGVKPSTLHEIKNNPDAIQKFVNQVHRQFDLMLIAEHFDESMVLLRRYMNWQMKDIIYIKVNTLSQKDNSVWRRHITPTAPQLDTFRRWASVDFALYDHFRDEFFKKISKEPYFEEEVAAFKKVQKSIANYCKNLRRFVPDKVMPANRWTEPFIISPSDCSMMTLDEVSIVKLARAKQLTRLRTAQPRSPRSRWSSRVRFTNRDTKPVDTRSPAS